MGDCERLSRNPGPSGDQSNGGRSLRADAPACRRPGAVANSARHECVPQAGILAVAQTYPEDPSALNNLARELVKLPGGEMSGFRKALRYSEEACQLEPENGDFLTTLGVAYYRVGNDEKALDVLAALGQDQRA